MPEAFVKEFARTQHLPTIWCPGCGLGTSMRILMKALADLEVDRNRLVVVSGIGCSSRMVGYLDCNTVHTTHGRALALATGIKLSRPELTVVAAMGDGDAASIGGNHLIHAARRNVDITTLVLNNSNYGMTSGQTSPMTPHESVTTTAPFGNLEHKFHLCDMVKGAGATYIARASTYHYMLAIRLVKKALKHRGFSFVELLTQCPVYFGRFNRMSNPSDMLRWLRDNAVKYVPGKEKELRDEQYYIGELFRDETKVEYGELLRQLRERVRSWEAKRS